MLTHTHGLTPRRYVQVVTAFFLLFLLVLGIAPLIGPTSVNLMKALSSDIPFAENVDANILFVARFPRILLGALTGGALAISGAVLQALLRNDLAAPFTLGISSGASLGAVIAIALNLNFMFLGFSSVPIAAFLGALGAMLLVFSLVKTRHGDFPTGVLLLAGVTANFFFASLVMFIHYLSDFTQSFQIVRWMMGGLDITSYETVWSILPLVLIGFCGLLYIARDLNLISAGVHSAQSRGVDVKRTQKLAFVLASLTTGTVVATSGPIGFVGLIVPHMVRLVIGPDLRLLIPASFFFGASFLILCDSFGRTFIAPVEIPVGVITALLGGPFFVWLLKRQR
ncbi:Vitamin B12 import system, permease protein BtuC [Nitrospina gracilis 3/211]|uniref:Vitamin B12 import system, permease protein BtuC n=1 Tax=Nitrospina gracilis (strain 3/211) TaxID=1266370 RepID=M1YZZ1_NITG3|nr:MULTISPECIES: iron ABC transporter permease [Nitrospina]MCF8724146.1 iron complex transport system permease protein [Nitrospina sp. Nb-3]CCQ91292.1 Vitamin B12 import system, permease protein BtuC [Nitrospina gracilis 3/211]